MRANQPAPWSMYIVITALPFLHRTLPNSQRMCSLQQSPRHRSSWHRKQFSHRKFATLTCHRFPYQIHENQTLRLVALPPEVISIYDPPFLSSILRKVTFALLQVSKVPPPELLPCKSSHFSQGQPFHAVRKLWRRLNSYSKVAL